MTIALARALPYLSPATSPDDTRPVRAYGSLDGPASRTFSATLNITYMIDEPGALVFVRQRDVERQPPEELHARATENLRRYASKRRIRFEAKGKIHIARLDGQHEASLLLLDELWDPPTRISDPEGELIAIVPARDTLMFTGSEAMGAVEELRAALDTGYEMLSPEIFVRRGGTWQPFG